MKVRIKGKETGGESKKKEGGRRRKKTTVSEHDHNLRCRRAQQDTDGQMYGKAASRGLAVP
jgi:hypothetical protein